MNEFDCLNESENEEEAMETVVHILVGNPSTSIIPDEDCQHAETGDTMENQTNGGRTTPFDHG